MSLASLMRYDINESFSETDVKISLGDLVELEHCETLVNWCHDDVISTDKIVKSVDSIMSRYKLDHDLTHLVRKRTFSYRYPFPSVVGLMRAEMDQLGDDGHVILTEYEALELMKQKTDQNLTLLNWHHKEYSLRLDSATKQHISNWRPYHGCLLWKPFILNHGEYIGRRGFSYGRVKGLYSRYSKLLSSSGDVSKNSHEISFL